MVKEPSRLRPPAGRLCFLSMRLTDSRISGLSAGASTFPETAYVKAAPAAAPEKQAPGVSHQDAAPCRISLAFESRRSDVGRHPETGALSSTGEPDRKNSATDAIGIHSNTSMSPVATIGRGQTSA